MTEIFFNYGSLFCHKTQHTKEKKKALMLLIYLSYASLLLIFVLIAADSSWHDGKILQIGSQCEDSHTNLYGNGGLSKGCLQWQSKRSFCIHS